MAKNIFSGIPQNFDLLGKNPFAGQLIKEQINKSVIKLRPIDPNSITLIDEENALFLYKDGEESRLAVKKEDGEYYVVGEGVEATETQRGTVPGIGGTAAGNAATVGQSGAELMQMPDGFTWGGLDPELKIYRKSSGRFSVDFDYRAKRLTSGLILYVDPVSGSDSNTGLSWGQALANMEAAIVAANASGGPTTIFAAPGRHLAGTWATACTVPIAIRCEGGMATFIRSTGPAFTPHPTLINVYSATVGTGVVGGVVDLKWLDAFGFPRRFLTAANGGEVEANPGSVQRGSATVNVQLIDSRAPDSDVFACRLSQPTFSNFTYLENVRFIGGHLAALFDGSGDACFVNCQFSSASAPLGSGRDACKIIRNSPSRIWLWGCAASSAGADGFNYDNTGSGTPCSVAELFCAGVSNGDATGADNGSTHHNGGSIIRVETFVYGNGNRNIHDVGSGTTAWNIGCFSGSPINQAGGVNSINYAVGGTSSSDTTKAWFDSCVSLGGAISDWVSYGSTQVFFSGTNWREGMTNNLAGSVVDYTEPAPTPLNYYLEIAAKLAP